MKEGDLCWDSCGCGTSILQVTEVFAATRRCWWLLVDGGVIFVTLSVRLLSLLNSVQDGPTKLRPKGRNMGSCSGWTARPQNYFGGNREAWQRGRKTWKYGQSN